MPKVIFSFLLAAGVLFAGVSCSQQNPIIPDPVIVGLLPPTTPPESEVYESKAGFIPTSKGDGKVLIPDGVFKIRPMKILPGRNSVFPAENDTFGFEFAFSVDCSVPNVIDDTGYWPEWKMVDSDGNQVGKWAFGANPGTKPCETHNYVAYLEYRSADLPPGGSVAAIKFTLKYGVGGGGGLVQIPTLAMVPIGWHR